MAAAQGNQYAAKARLWTQAIGRALDKRSMAEKRDALDELAEKLLAACDAGEGWALKELGDRLEGKAAQALEVSGNGGGPLVVQMTANEINL